MEFIMAIAWTVCFICDIILWRVGQDPSWIMVFCPTLMLIVVLIDDYFRRKM